MKLYKIKKRVVKRLIAFLLTLFVTAGSVIGCPAVPSHAAALPAIPALVNYVLTVMGAVSVTDNIVGKVTGDSIITRLTDAISTCLGDGSIYVSADGDYVFNSDSTAAIYEALLDDDSIDAKVVSNFSGNYQNLYFYNWDYVSPQFISAIQNSVLNYSKYLCFFGVMESSYYNYYCPSFVVVDISNVAYFSLNNNDYFILYNSSGSSVTCPCTKIYQYYNTSSASYGDVVVSSSELSTLRFSSGYSGNGSTAPGTSYLYYSIFKNENDLSSDYFSSTVSLYENFPYFSNNKSLITANRSIVISKTSNSGLSLSNQSSGVVYNNYYDIFPSVSQTVIEENNWENIYTSYVNEVNTEYQVSYNENGSVDAEELRAILKSVGDRIAEIIEDAGGEIIENLDDIMTWLSRIYDRLGLIESGLSGSGTDLTTVESYLDSIESLISSCATDLDRLQQIYVLLGQILVAINARGGGGDIVVGLPDVSNTDILEYITKAQVLASLLETVMPFCFVTMFGTLLNQIGVQPVTPVYHVPFTMHNTFVDIDEEVVLDFSIMQDFRDVMYHVWCIAFDILLVWLTFYLLGRVDEILF